MESSQNSINPFLPDPVAEIEVFYKKQFNTLDRLISKATKQQVALNIYFIALKQKISRIGCIALKIML